MTRDSNINLAEGRIGLIDNSNMTSKISSKMDDFHTKYDNDTTCSHLTTLNSNKDDMESKSETSTIDAKNMSTLEPHDNDVLCGRGGSINTHPGNETFRRFVERRKRIYLTARFKREKRLIASSVVREIRALNPPGRFLTKEKGSEVWKDIGDEKARDKTSQALRENAPTLRKEIEIENDAKRAEMRRQEEAEFRYREAECSARGRYYHYASTHTVKRNYALSYDEYDECDQGYNGYHHQRAPGEKNVHLSHRDPPYYDDNVTSNQVRHDDQHDDQRNKRYSQTYREWHKCNPNFCRPPPQASSSLNGMPASNLRTSSTYSHLHLNEKRTVQCNHNDGYRGNDTDYHHHGEAPSSSTHERGQDEKPLKSWQRFRNQTGDYRDRRQSCKKDGYRHYDYAMMDDDIEDPWNVEYQDDENMSDTPSSSLGNSHHHSPDRRQHELADSNNASCSGRRMSGQTHQNYVEKNDGLMHYEPEDKNTKASLFASFAKSVLSWDRNNGVSSANQEYDSGSTFTTKEPSRVRARKKVGRINDGQEAELITIMESMSVDDDPCNQQQGGCKKMRMTSDNRSLVTSDREIRTQPQGEIITQPQGAIEKVVEPEEDWSSKVGGCHKWLKDNLNAVSLFKEENEIGIGISPADSLDTEGASVCGADIFSCAGSIGGASLCNIFDSDMALGDNAPIPLTHIAGNIQSMAVKNTTSDRILSQRKHVDHVDVGLLSSTFSQDSLAMSDIAPYAVTEVTFPDPKPDTIESTASREKIESFFTTSNFTYSWDGRSAK